MIIGVAGGSGSGKTTFARDLAISIGPERVQILAQDSYYHDLSSKFHGDGSVNFDHPDSIDWELLADHVEKLSHGIAVAVPIYDFATHTRKKEVILTQPKPFIVVDGILILYPDALRNAFNLKIFIDTAEPVRFARRLKRDTTERGRTADGVRVQYDATVKPMHDQFVEPTKTYADHIVSGEGLFQFEIDRVVKELPALVR